jgi:hypothetical protein
VSLSVHLVVHVSVYSHMHCFDHRSAERLNLADSGLSESIPIEIYDLSGLGKLVNPTASSAVPSQMGVF